MAETKKPAELDPNDITEAELAIEEEASPPANKDKSKEDKVVPARRDEKRKTKHRDKKEHDGVNWKQVGWFAGGTILAGCLGWVGRGLWDSKHPPKTSI